MRIDTSNAGMSAAKYAHTGSGRLSPSGLTTQPLFCGAVGVKPSGTSNF